MSRAHRSNPPAEHAAVEVIDGYPGSSLSHDVQQAARALRALTRRVQARPYPYLGAAVAIGFVIGGGLWGRLGRLFLTVGARAAFTMLLGAAASQPSTPSSGA